MPHYLCNAAVAIDKLGSGEAEADDDDRDVDDNVDCYNINEEGVGHGGGGGGGGGGIGEENVAISWTGCSLEAWVGQLEKTVP